MMHAPVSETSTRWHSLPRERVRVRHRRPGVRSDDESPAKSTSARHDSPQPRIERPPPPSPSRRIRSIDGLRALSVIAVLTYHVRPSLLPGGFLGVDVFLVISGFVVTTVLLHDITEQGRIRFARFYARRIRRLIPTLLLVVTAVALVTYSRGAYTSARVNDSLASLGFVMNWREALTGGSYFAAFADPSPTRHLWSLAVEEQWYLIWPVVLFVMWRRNRTLPVVPVAAAAAVAATWWWAIRLGASDPSRAYYGTDTRVAILLMGAGAGLLHTRSGLRVSRWIGVLALGVVGVCWRLGHAEWGWAHPWLFLIVGVATTVLIGAVVDDNGLLARALSVRPLQWLGDASYAIYLWHWPVLLLTPDSLLDRLPAPHEVSMVAITLLLSALTLHLIERPLRKVRTRICVPIIAAAAVGVLVLTLSLPVAPSTAAPAPLAAGEQRGNAGAPVVMVIGDSVSASLGAYFDADMFNGALTVDTQAEPGCGLPAEAIVTNDGEVPRNSLCVEIERGWARRFETHPPDAMLTVLGGWEMFDVVIDGRTVAFGSPEWEEHLVSRLDSWFAPAYAANVPVVITDVPCFGQLDGQLRKGAGFERYDVERQAAVNDLIARYGAQHPGIVTVVHPSEALCRDGEPIERLDRYDGVHFSGPGAERIWQWLEPQLRPLLAG
jgi:peptidoglycan/LPS O-acetylase OafA/YrhL